MTDASQQALAQAQGINAIPYQSLYDVTGGNLVAGTSPYTTQAWQQIANLQGQGTQDYQNAINTYTSLLGLASPQGAMQASQAVYQPAAQNYAGALQGVQNAYGDVMGQAQGMFGQYLANARPATAADVSSNLYQLMSPYVNLVTNPTETLMQQQLSQNLASNAAQANNVGAFGGSRMGVQNAVAQAQEPVLAGQYLGNLLNQGYYANLTPSYNLASQASQQGYGAAGLLANLGSQYAQQYSNLLGTSAGNLNSLLSGLYGTNLQAGMTAAQQLPNVTSAMQQQALTEANALSAAGTAQQQQQQSYINAALANYMWQNYYPQQQLDTYLSALGSIPYGSTTTSYGYGSQKGTTSYNPSVYSTLGGAMSLLGSTGTATTPGTGILGFLSSLWERAMSGTLDPNALLALQALYPSLTGTGPFLGATSATPAAGAGSSDIFSGGPVLGPASATGIVPGDGTSLGQPGGADASGIIGQNTTGGSFLDRLGNAVNTLGGALGSGKGSQQANFPAAPGGISIPTGSSQPNFGRSSSGLSYARGALPNLLKWKGLLGI